MHRLALHDARRDDLERPRLIGLQRALLLEVQGLREWVHHAAEERLTDLRLRDEPCRVRLVALADLVVRTEQHAADRVLFEVQRDAHNPVAEVDQLLRHGLREAIHLRDAVANLQHNPGAGQLKLFLICSEPVVKDRSHLFRSHRQLRSLPQLRACIHRSALHHSLADTLQARPQAGIQHSVPDPHRDASKQIRIHDCINHDTLPKPCRQRRREPLGLVVRQRTSRTLSSRPLPRRQAAGRHPHPSPTLRGDRSQ